VVLLRNIRATQERLAMLADVQPAERAAVAEQPIELFLARLRTAWKDGAIRPTDRPIVKAMREHRRPDPLIQARPDLRRWFEAEPWRSGSQLQLRLQTEHPSTYPEKLLRMLQRRLKAWRSDTARALLFGSLERSRRGRNAPLIRRGACANGRALRNPDHLGARPVPPQAESKTDEATLRPAGNFAT
jgi:hypothetical protein